MKRLLPVLALGLAVVVSACSSASSMSELAGNPMISQLAGSIPGMDATKAVAAAGSYLSVAEGKMAEADYDAMIDVIPGGKDIKKQALSLGGLDKMMGISDMNGLMSKLGVTADQSEKVATGMSDFISKQGKPDVAEKFKQAIM